VHSGPKTGTEGKKIKSKTLYCSHNKNLHFNFLPSVPVFNYCAHAFEKWLSVEFDR
jgi:hypothetical protein